MLLRQWRFFVAMATLAICIVIWSSTLSPKKPLVALESIRFNYWHVSLGQDTRGLPTGMLSSKCTLGLKVKNADGLWGYHLKGFVNMNIFLRNIASTPIEKVYAARRSTTELLVELRSDDVPLYGASPSVAHPDGGNFYVIFQAALQTEAGVLPLLYKHTFTDVISCQLTGVSAGTNLSLAIVSRNSCPRISFH